MNNISEVPCMQHSNKYNSDFVLVLTTHACTLQSCSSCMECEFQWCLAQKPAIPVL